MVRLKFRGGPWDGVEFDAQFRPDAVTLPHMQFIRGKNPETGLQVIGTNLPSEHHVYLSAGPIDDDETEFAYEYKVDGKPWWDHLRQQSP